MPFFPSFTCCECGREIIDFPGNAPRQPPLCCTCLFLPGWFRDPAVRLVFDPQHDGREVLERPLHVSGDSS